MKILVRKKKKKMRVFLFNFIFPVGCDCHLEIPIRNQFQSIRTNPIKGAVQREGGGAKRKIDPDIPQGFDLNEEISVNEPNKRPKFCNHKCKNKVQCKHPCCKRNPDVLDYQNNGEEEREDDLNPQIQSLEQYAFMERPTKQPPNTIDRAVGVKSPYFAPSSISHDSQIRAPNIFTPQSSNKSLNSIQTLPSLNLPENIKKSIQGSHISQVKRLKPNYPLNSHSAIQKQVPTPPIPKPVQPLLFHEMNTKYKPSWTNPTPESLVRQQRIEAQQEISTAPLEKKEEAEEEVILFGKKVRVQKSNFPIPSKLNNPPSLNLSSSKNEELLQFDLFADLFS